MAPPRFYQRWVAAAGRPPLPEDGTRFADARFAYMLGVQAVLELLDRPSGNQLECTHFYAHGAEDILEEIAAARSRGNPNPFEAALNAVIGEPDVRKEEEEEEGRARTQEAPED